MSGTDVEQSKGKIILKPALHQRMPTEVTTARLLLVLLFVLTVFPPAVQGRPIVRLVNHKVVWLSISMSYIK